MLLRSVLQYLRLSQQCCWRITSSGIWC